MAMGRRNWLPTPHQGKHTCDTPVLGIGFAGRLTWSFHLQHIEHGLVIFQEADTVRLELDDPESFNIVGSR